MNTFIKNCSVKNVLMEKEIEPHQDIPFNCVWEIGRFGNFMSSIHEEVSWSEVRDEF